jgi:excisionase family DNA binding protein
MINSASLHSATTASPLLTADEVAALLRTTRKAVYDRVARGAMPGVVRMGRRVLFRRDEVYAALGLAA